MSLEETIEQCRQAWNDFAKGNPESVKPLFSQGEDVSLANPWGPAVRGWTQVSQTLDAAAARFRDGETLGVEGVTNFVTDDLACFHEIERFQAKVSGSPDVMAFALRVTTVYRHEDQMWKIVLRHADPITAPQPPDVLFRR